VKSSRCWRPSSEHKWEVIFVRSQLCQSVPRGSVCVKQCRAKLRGVKHNQDNHTGMTTDLDPCLAVVTTILSHFASRTVLAVH
jgi:hypothetical protein